MERGPELRLRQRHDKQALSRSTRRHQRALSTYFQLPKHLIAPTKSETLWQHGGRLQPQTPHEFAVSSAILSEIAITDTSRSSAERHALLDMAEWDLSEALAAAYSRQEERNDVYHRHFLLSPHILRTSSHQAAHHLFRGMVDGDVSTEVRQTYAHEILALSARASDGYRHFHETSTEFQSSRETEYLGLAHELNAIYSIARMHTPTLAAFPTFPRGDSGTHLPHQTHDMHVIEMQWGHIENSLTAEVKTTPRPEHYERYEAILIGGTVHLHPDNSPDPSHLTELYVKEAKQLASPDELARVEEVSQTVIHTLRHGFRGSEQCRDPRSCELIA